MAVSLPLFNAFTAAVGASPTGWSLAVAVLAVALVSAVLLQPQSLGSRVDLFFARMRRRVAMDCRPNAAGTHPARIACWLTPEALRAPLFHYDQQKEAVQALAGACAQGSPGQYWFLEGRSGSGKTRTGLLLVQALVRDLKLLEYGNRSYRYDFGDSKSAQDALVRSLGTSRHDQAVVIVDNFQLVRRKVLAELTSRLVDPLAPPPERLILFLARPPEAWNLSPGVEVRLISEAKAASRFIKLEGPPARELANSVSPFVRAGLELLRDLQRDDAASAPQLPVAQVIARNGEAPRDLSTLVGLLRGDTAAEGHLDLVRVLAVITALSMHRGAFSRSAFRRASRIASDDATRWGTMRHRVRMRTTLRRVRRVGIISRSHHRRGQYEFHEAIAKLCIDRLSPLPGFQVPFTVVGRSRLRELSAGDDPLTTWLTAVEVGAQEAAEAHFDAAMANGPYTRMVRCLRRASARYPLSATLRLQLAVLLDRTGDFAASREEFTDELVQELDPSSELAVIFATTRLEASHDADSAAGLALLCNHPDRLVAIVGEYWKLHMAAHRGSFASQKLLDLATEALELLGSRESHWLNYSLARMHFDSLRHHYLEGGAPTDAVVSRERLALAEYLQTRIATFEAFDTLYTRAHLVAHVLLPQRAIFREPVTPAQAQIARVRPQDVETVDRLVATAQRLYRLARDQFWQYGDREAAYLQADLLNARMIDPAHEVDEVDEVERVKYERFIAGTGFDDIASYPHLGYVRWNMLMRYRVLRAGGPSAAGAAAAHLDEARRHLDRVVELDTHVGNEYGLMRARLLEILMRGVDTPPAPEDLASLAVEMAKRGYAREEKLLVHLAGRRPLPNHELEAVFRYYPFVGQ